jgi:long-chain acyl-CoA synthetase
MHRDTLVGVFEDLDSTQGECLVYDDGFRTWRYGYRDVAEAARGFAGRLHQAGLGKGDAVLFWSENRPEWIAAFWGCLIAGIVVVPIDYRSSATFARRIGGIVRARVALVGDDVPAIAGGAAAVRTIGEAPAWRLARLDWRDARRAPPVALTTDDVAEIVFTSGATAEPKGVVITHRNILANIVPVEREVSKYRRWGGPFFPLRVLDLLPLSHMFGQAMAAFIPPMLPGTVVFMRGFNPADIVSQVRSRRVSVLVSVPKILDVLAGHVRRTMPGAADPPPRGHVARRWWHYRAVHRAFGPKFWAFVVGAASLDPALEEFWSGLGFLVIQGYGLTETAPIVSLNHPFAARKGSVGKVIGGVEVTIGSDGEILVRGDNVTRGYYGDEGETAGAFEDGWFHTGDIGELDARGQLFVKGRKKEMIVTPEGLNVFPEDVERALNAQPGVIDSAVVGLARGGEERVHAVVVVAPGADTGSIVRHANAQLADHQRIRGISVWPGAELPRTEGTRKLRRREIRRSVETGAAAPDARPVGQSIDALLARYAGGREIRPETTLEELGLSSLDRVELMVAIEERVQASVDENRFTEAHSVGDLQALVAAEGAPTPAPARSRSGGCRRGIGGASCRPSAGRASRRGCCRSPGSSPGFAWTASSTWRRSRARSSSRRTTRATWTPR